MNLLNLPPENITQILLNLPYIDVKDACNMTEFEAYCDNHFWRALF